MPEAHILPALPADAADLSRISVAAKAHWGYPRPWLNHWAKDLILTPDDWDRQAIWKLLLDTELIGFCAIADEGAIYSINHLWIKPGWMRQGWGRHLLAEAIRRSAPDPKPIEVISDPHALPFYLEQGFRQVGETESYPPGRMLPVLRRV